MAPKHLFSLILLASSSRATTVLYNPSSPATGPFPSDVLTVLDPTQRTGRRLNLPVPDCASQYTACQEVAVLEQSDGFSLRPRIVVRFSGPVNTATLRDGIFLQAIDGGGAVPINQVVFDPATNTMYAKPDVALAEGTRYALIVTDAVKDASGAPVVSDPAFLSGASTAGQGGTTIAILSPGRPVAVSIFTTMSATAWLDRARNITPFIPPLVQLAQPRSTFRIADLASLTLHEQTGANPPRFSDLTLPLDPTLLAGVDRVVIGSFRSPRFLEDDQTIRPYPTLPDLSIPDRTEEIGFNALLPATPKPAAGYPVVIFGHGFGDSRFGGPTAVAPALARAGFAVIAINAVGHGFGPQSTAILTDRSGNVTTLPTLGRSIDLNGDGVIEANEGCAVITPVPYGLRDCFRQTVVDLMQLARIIRRGLDLDTDGSADLDPAHIYYAGQSLGAMYGTMFTAVEPSVRAAVLNVGGATGVEIARWSPAYKSYVTDLLRLNLPPLLNQGATFNEDYVLPDQPVKTSGVPGAIAIQNALELSEWLSLEGDPISFAPRLAQRRVLFQMARADRTMPNPASTALIRAAGQQANTWMYRHDLARAKAPDLPLDPHPFLVFFISLDGASVQFPGIQGLAITSDAQNQVAGFFASDGTVISDPNFLSRALLGIPVFEKPAALPQDLGF